MGIWTALGWPGIGTDDGRFMSAVMNLRVP